jgi:neopullulanase
MPVEEGICPADAQRAFVSIHSVEPPSWWRNAVPQTIRLLIRGTRLKGLSLEIDGPGVRLGTPAVNEAGTALFCDLTLAPDAPPGTRTLRAGSATATFTVLAAPAPRLGGLTGSDILYLILPDRFCDADPTNNHLPEAPGLYDPKRPRHYHGGDLAGIRRKLPYLKDLGATALWLTPLYKNALRAHPTLVYDGEPAIDYHGYGAVDFYAIEPHFGSSADLHALITEAHRLGIKIVQDQVANHTGPQHPWATDPPTPAWLNPKLPCDWNIFNVVNPYASAASKRATLQGWFANILPDLNQSDPECRRYLIQNALWWVGVFGFDGIRQDTVPYVPIDFWQDWHAALRAAFPGLTTLGEVNLPDPMVNAVYQKPGAGFDQLYDFPLFTAITKAFTGNGSLDLLTRALAADRLYADPTSLVTFLGLHDEPRFLGRKGASIEAMKLAATFLFTTRGIPLWYYADEVGLAGGTDPDNRRHFPGGFPKDAKNKFTASGRSKEENSLFDHIRALMHLRHRSPALHRGDTRILHTSRRQLVYTRTYKDETVLVAFNTARRTVRLCIGGRYLRLPARSATRG